MKEGWKQIPGYSTYHVSNTGKVFSFGGMKMLSPGSKPDGRLVVNLYNTQGRKQFHVHILVLLAFVGPAPVGTECSHLDGDNTNNSLDNLKWESHSKNNWRKDEHGTMLKGTKIHQAILNEEQVLEIKRLYNRGETYKSIGYKFGVDACTIGHIINRRTWRHVK